jgi:hypothetical protein
LNTEKIKGERLMIVIHHGSGVETALGELLEDKNLVKPPYKDLKADAVRDLVDTYSQVWPIRNPVIVAGPLDEANPSTLDILLKRIEEPLEGSPELILWARDYGSVPPTIRSRCGEQFHYQFVGQHELYQLAETLLKGLLEKNLVVVSDSLRKVDTGQYRAFLEAYVEVILDREEVDLYTEDLKMVLRRPRVSQVALYGFFLGGLKCQ